MPKTAKHLAGATKAGKKFMFRLSEELLGRLKCAAELRGMEVSEYLRKAGTDALNNDKEFVKNNGKTAYFGALPAQIQEFLDMPLSKEEIYYGNNRRIEAEASLKTLANRLTALEAKVSALEKLPSKGPVGRGPSKPSVNQHIDL
jgi:hypothetical protein